ncbi:elongation factor Ts [Photobacterium aphoticum]|uniref:Translation elongation factor Ts n=1 Tax=Photobacterium aphoticum TaxID=754436 RepID=A0A0J1GK55_9GAMM|nr:hypothetical protein [Photobacterium aphoticum]KLU99995.1 translation elongation factor Ts [Photobacterium aphoticum]PSU58579.1 elongation factor Ts [Photobacterium aphoticum]GHA48021.1 translation elongation factor Ts [Photobacterium aphoticum]
MGTRDKQQQIQKALDTLGWSHRQFADVIYEELNDNDDFQETDKNDIRKLAQNIKKQLQRSSTPEELLNRYLKTLSEHPDYQALKLDSILPRHVPHSCISDELAIQLTQLSYELDPFDDGKEGH